MPKSYVPLAYDDGIDNCNNVDGSFTLDDDAEDDDAEGSSGPSNVSPEMVPLELSTLEDADDDDAINGSYSRNDQALLLTWSNAWPLQACLYIGLIAPVVIRAGWIFYSLTGRVWTTTPFVLYIAVSVLVSRWHFIVNENQTATAFLLVTSFAAVVDTVLFGVAFPQVWEGLSDQFFTDYDGTDVVEWAHYKRDFRLFGRLGWVISVARFVLGCTAVVARICSACKVKRRVVPWTSPCIYLVLPWNAVSSKARTCLRLYLNRIFCVAAFVSWLVLVWCLNSLGAHLLPWSVPFRAGDYCDDLDETECVFPFPSFYHMRADPTTATGWIVDLPGRVLPPLKGGVDFHLDFVNRLDGFPTMGPLLFYMQGLKEAHEAGIGQLKGAAYIAESVTRKSVTFLVDVEAKRLVPHTAEIDYIDSEYPSVMIFPAAPLKHNTHYALAVVNATDAQGRRLSPTPGMQRLWADTNNARRYRYISTLIPALQDAADWLNFAEDPDSLQLLFDYQTISEGAQLGTVRAVRDSTIAHIDSKKTWSWQKHVRTVRVQENDCSFPNSVTARTVHAELDVPWFLDGFGPGKRSAVMDTHAEKAGRSRLLGTSKFVVHIPCSLRAAALGLEGGKPLRAVLDFGHGLFASRGEAAERFLQKMATDQGYVIVAMDWRGVCRMCVEDSVLRVLLPDILTIFLLR
jgi:hypothetical protein